MKLSPQLGPGTYEERGGIGKDAVAADFQLAAERGLGEAPKPKNNDGAFALSKLRLSPWVAFGSGYIGSGGIGSCFRRRRQHVTPRAGW